MNVRYPFAVIITRGNSGKYTARSQFGTTRGDYDYDSGMGGGDRQALHHARRHADKFTIPDRRIIVATMPDGKSTVATVLPEIDPERQLHISATYWWGNGGYEHRVRVWRGQACQILDIRGSGGNGQHYETAFRALVHMEVLKDRPNGAAATSQYWRDDLEAVDHGYTEVSRKKDM